MTLGKHRIGSLTLIAMLLAAVGGTIYCLVAVASDDDDATELEGLLGTYATSRPVRTQHAPGKPGKPGKTPADETAARLAKRCIFAPAPPKPSFSAKLQGVLGDKAYFVGKPVGLAVGQDINGAKIKEVGPDWVKVEFQGTSRTLQLAPMPKGIKPAPPGKSGTPPPPGKSGAGRPTPPPDDRGAKGRPPTVTVAPDAPSGVIPYGPTKSN